MNAVRWSVSLAAAVGVIAAALAAATIWLLLTDPVGGAETVSQAVATGDVAPFLRAIGDVIVDMLRNLFQYL
jgi:hypothetical protein